MTDAAAPSLVFVGGVHRSGTSLVHRLLRGHPEISGFADTGVWEDEGQHLQDVLPTGRQLGGPGRWGYADGAPLTEASALTRPETRDGLWAAWSPRWDLGKPVLVEKSPPNLLRFRLLRALWPDARLVAVVRHPIAVAESTRRMRPRRRLRSTASVVAHWAECMDRFEQDRARLPDVHVVRFEELAADPEAVWGALQDYVGVARAPASEAVRPDADARWEAHWARTRALRPLKARCVEGLEHRVRRHGYTLRGFARH